MFNTILVPLDGSVLAERALPHAQALARATGARLALIRAAEEVAPLGVSAPRKRVAAMAEAEAYVTAVAARLLADGFAVDTGVVHEGAADAIADEAERRGAGLIAMATHGRGGLGRLVFGSGAETVLRRAATPLLLVRAWGDAPEIAPLGARPRLLVPLDGSAFAEAALPVAAGLAGELGGDLVLLHAVSPFDQAFMPAVSLANFPADQAARGEEARGYLRGIVARGGTGACEALLDVRFDVPTLAIEEAVRDHRADLVVMATHGRTAVGRLVLGGVADAVLRHSRVPLLLVRPRQLGAAEDEPVAAGDGVPVAD